LRNLPVVRGSKDDGSGIVSECGGQGDITSTANVKHLVESRTAPEPAATDSHIERRLRKAPSIDYAGQLSRADCDKSIRLRGLKAVDEVLSPHARIDQHRRGAGAEQSEDQLNKFDARLHEQHDSAARRHAELYQSACQRRGVIFQLAIGASGVGAAVSADNSRCVRHLPGYFSEAISNINAFGGHRTIVAVDKGR
jgi:hypothetical protein